MTVATPGAEIHYRLDGQEPTLADPPVASGGSVVIDRTRTLTARAWKAGSLESPVASASYTLVVAVVTFSPAGGTYTAARTVSLATTTPGAAVRYTTDGTTPSEGTPTYTTPLTIATSTTVKAVGVREGLTSSAVATAVYTMNFGTLAPPVPEPAGGTFISEALVSLTAAPMATIRYTLDGTTPTGSSPIYTTPLTLTATTTVKAQAVHPDYGASAVTAATYTIQVAAPIFGMPGGVYAPGQGIPIATPTAGAAITYTLTGLDPTASDPGIPSSGGVTAGRFWLKARAWKGGCVASPVTEAWYDVTGPVTPPLVAAGQLHSLAVRADGVGLSWGSNAAGQLGTGTQTARAVPGVVAGAAGYLAVSGGNAHTVAVRLDGSVVASGYNSYGQLGDGTTSLRLVPVSVSGLGPVVAVSAGTYHTLAVQAGGTVMAWGLNTSGQVGAPSGDLHSTPHLVAGLTGVTAVAAGGMFSLALTGDGQVWAWGANDSGQLGDGTTVSRSTPVAVSGLPAIVHIAAGSAHALAVGADGTLWGWGHNFYGQLGQGAGARWLVPVSVPGLSTVSRVAAGAWFSLALTAEGTVRAWGSNTTGQLGDGTTTTRPTPQGVPGLTTVAQIAAGGTHALALADDGTVWAWGGNDVGQLGDGTTTTRLTPVAISGAGMTWRLPPPTLNVASGTYAAPFDVTVTSPDPTASLHYTTTGMEPTEADPVVGSAGTITIDGTLTLKVRAWTPSLGASLTATATYTFNYGTLATPVADPAGGAYATAQVVTLSAAPGATIRYTMDGTDPTAASPAYTAPLTLSAAVTLKARAFQADWTMSAVLTETYTWPDTTPPTISAVVSPPPTAAGWHTAAVEVTFVCADETAIATCPEPIWVTADGAGQVVTGEAVDTAGNRATASVTVNLDRTPPRLTVFSPDAEAIVAEGTTVITVRGSVTDVTSGVGSVTCGSGTAAIVDRAYACETVVGAGTSVLHVEARDAAGLVVTRDALVTVGGPLTPPPVALAVTPAVMTLVAGETRGLQAIDDRERRIPDATWSVADPAVATVTVVGGDPVVQALAPGQTTVTASWAGLTAETTVTVWAAGATLPAGTTVWALAGTAPAQGRVLPAFPVDPTGADGDPAAFFFLAEQPAASVQGVARDGRLRWQRPLGAPLLQAAADAGGGLVTLHGQRFTTTMVEGALQRRDGLTGTVTWEYLPTQDAGGYEAALSEVALHPDGTVYVTETRDTATDLLALDGRTGAVRHRIVLGASYFERWVDGVREVAGFVPAEATAPLVRADGTVAVVVYTATTTSHWRTTDCPGPRCHDHSDTLETLELVELSEAGTATRRALTPGSVDFTYRHLIRLLPDGGDGFLFVSRTPVVGATGTFDVGEIHHVAATGTLSGGVAVGTDTPQVVLGADAAYALAPGWFTGHGLPTAPPDAQVTTFDPATGTALASARLEDGLDWRLAFAPDGGGVVLTGPRGSTGIDALPLSVSLRHAIDAGGGAWVGWQTGPAMAVGAEVAATGRWAYAAGDVWQANRESCPCMPRIENAALSGSVTFVVPAGTFAPDEHLWFADAVDQWNDAIQGFTPATTLGVSSSPIAGHRNVSVTNDPTTSWAGLSYRGAGDWWIKVNPAEYEVSQAGLIPDYLRGLYLHELGHIAGFGHVDCLRTESVMGTKNHGGVYAGRATCLMGGDLCAVRLRYGRRP